MADSSLLRVYRYSRDISQFLYGVSCSFINHGCIKYACIIAHSVARSVAHFVRGIPEQFTQEYPPLVGLSVSHYLLLDIFLAYK